MSIAGVWLLLGKIEMTPIGVVKRELPGEDILDRKLVSKIVLKKKLGNGLNGIDEFSHVFIIYWLDKISDSQKRLVVSAGSPEPVHMVGIFATRMPIRPNPIGLSLVELVKHEKNTVWVRGLDALDNTPVLDIKPYPECVKGQLIAVDKFKIPSWLR